MEGHGALLMHTKQAKYLCLCVFQEKCPVVKINEGTGCVPKFRTEPKGQEARLKALPIFEPLSI
jgi:hypothetical protein